MAAKSNKGKKNAKKRGLKKAEVESPPVGQVSLELVLKSNDLFNLKLTTTTPLTSAKGHPVWDIIKRLSLSKRGGRPHTYRRLIGLIANAVCTERKAEFLMSETLINELIEQALDFDRGALNGKEFGAFMRVAKLEAILIEISPPVTKGKYMAGLYKLNVAEVTSYLSTAEATPEIESESEGESKDKNMTRNLSFKEEGRSGSSAPNGATSPSQSELRPEDKGFQFTPPANRDEQRAPREHEAAEVTPPVRLKEVTGDTDVPGTPIPVQEAEPEEIKHGTPQWHAIRKTVIKILNRPDTGKTDAQREVIKEVRKIKGQDDRASIFEDMGGYLGLELGKDAWEIIRNVCMELDLPPYN